MAFWPYSVANEWFYQKKKKKRLLQLRPRAEQWVWQTLLALWLTQLIKGGRNGNVGYRPQSFLKCGVRKKCSNSVFKVRTIRIIAGVARPTQGLFSKSSEKEEILMMATPK